MSISQMLVMYLGFVLPFLIVPPPQGFKHILATLVVLLFSSIGWAFCWALLFSSPWYKGVEQAVGFTVGF